MNNLDRNSRTRVQGLTLTAVVAALYAAVTMMVAPIGFGPVQLRLSEGLNHLAAWNKRYIVALSLGVLIANLMSPMGWIDWVFGTLDTLIMTSLTYYLTRRIASPLKKIVISTFSVLTVGMAILAAEFTFAFAINAAGSFAPDHAGSIWANWLSYYLMLVPGELASLVVGGIIIFALSKFINLSK
ncbi:QueT transporter family protein [Fructobacillus sp. M1-13]|uniref:QueT transporter family protein n=1 Tax=Fructobacillus papyriferae TaxID=2713171 RepID=A0ABS5QQN9_9LACO|nr:QueT transporter family protein [Fructobacillus papyriferae]MBS9334820.1 QueT transporter family protein [Fructobacillus papyriferae]MCD2158810.1 QueT transporter family protein [Fructobacillus papyriferae]